MIYYYFAQIALKFRKGTYFCSFQLANTKDKHKYVIFFHHGQSPNFITNSNEIIEFSSSEKEKEQSSLP